VVWQQDFDDYEATANPKPAFSSCVPREGPLFFTISDKNQDGLCCNTDSGFFLPDGSRGYDVYLDGELVGSREFPFGSHQDLLLRDSENASPVNIIQPRIWCPDCNRCDICPDGGDFRHDEFIAFDIYGIINCNDYFVNMSSYIDTNFCSQHHNHISSSCGCTEHAHKCVDGESLLTFQMILGDSLGEITVQIRNKHNVTLWSKIGFVGEIGETRGFQACVPAFEPLFVGIYNYCGDGLLCSFDYSVYHPGSFEVVWDSEPAVNQTFSSSEIELSFGVQYTMFPTAAPQIKTDAPATVTPTTLAPSVGLELESNDPS